MQPVLQLKKVLYPARRRLHPRYPVLEALRGDNDDQNTGIEIVKRAIEEPLRQIVVNAGRRVQ
jgi:hypothetical protein